MNKIFKLALSAFVAVIAICAILLAFYIFDDKIKRHNDKWRVAW